MTLDKLNVGDKANITGFLGNDIASARLIELGLIEGEEVSVINKAPWGDPILIRVMNYSLSIRIKDAALIEISKE